MAVAAAVVGDLLVCDPEDEDGPGLTRKLSQSKTKTRFSSLFLTLSLSIVKSECCARSQRWETFTF